MLVGMQQLQATQGTEEKTKRGTRDSESSLRCTESKPECDVESATTGKS